MKQPKQSQNVSLSYLHDFIEYEVDKSTKNCTNDKYFNSTFPTIIILINTY